MSENIVENKIKSLTDDELKQCFDDITEYSKKGMMGDTLTRQIRDELAEKLGSDKWDRACNIIVIPEILYEIARRHYNK